MHNERIFLMPQFGLTRTTEERSPSSDAGHQFAQQSAVKP
jgi:hypothetical protein